MGVGGSGVEGSLCHSGPKLFFFFFPNSYPLFHTIIFLLLMFCSHAYCLMVAMWLLQF